MAAMVKVVVSSVVIASLALAAGDGGGEGGGGDGGDGKGGGEPFLQRSMRAPHECQVRAAYWTESMELLSGHSLDSTTGLALCGCGTPQARPGIRVFATRGYGQSVSRVLSPDCS